MRGDILIPYIWAATGLFLLFVIVVMIYWAYNHNQFDENISDQIFTKDDDDRYS